MKKVCGCSPLTDEQNERLNKLAKLPDSEIDTSEIPEWNEDDFRKAVLFSEEYQPRKKQITARIDADVLLWLKSHGKGYQTLMNNLLRKEMLEELSKGA